MKKLLLIAGVVIAIIYFSGGENELVPTQSEVSYNNNSPVELAPTQTEVSYNSNSPEQSSSSSDELLLAAFEGRRNGYQAQGGGEVIRLLSDDNDGSRHQRFIVRLSSGQTILVAHNIDLANRINSLSVGDYVEFNGEYEWNSEGGVIHWTHHDPQGRHVAGWLKHEGSTYQ